MLSADSPDDWRPLGFWGRYGWLWILIPAALLAAGTESISVNAHGGVAEGFGEASVALAIVGGIALLFRVLTRHGSSAGRVQVQLGHERWHRLRRSRLRSIVEVSVFAIAIEGLLILAVFIGWQKADGELLRHAAGTQHIVATVTHSQESCNGRGSCSYDSYGDYVINGHHETNVQLVSESGERHTGKVTVLVNPTHPRRAIWIHDHGQFWIVLGALALVVLLVGNPLWIRRHRRVHARTSGRQAPETANPDRAETAPTSAP